MTTRSINLSNTIIKTTNQVPTRHLKYFNRYFNSKRNANKPKSHTLNNEYHKLTDNEQLSAVRNKHDLTYWLNAITRDFKQSVSPPKITQLVST